MKTEKFSLVCVEFSVRCLLNSELINRTQVMVLK